jgi:hypothetical protein
MFRIVFNKVTLLCTQFEFHEVIVSKSAITSVN